MISWSRTQELDGVLSRNRARRMIETIALHQMIGGSPVAMAVEHGASDTAAQHAGECFLIFFRLPLGDDFLALREAANMQASFVCGPTPKALQVWRVGFLDAFHVRVVIGSGSCNFVVVFGLVCKKNGPLNQKKFNPVRID